jgi:hypothetical protein
MNRRPSPFPTAPPSPLHFCVSALSSSDLFPSPLTFNPSASSGVTFIDAASTLTPLFATLTKNTRGVGTSASPSTFLGPSFFIAASRTHTNARNSFFFRHLLHNSLHAQGGGIRSGNVEQKPLGEAQAYKQTPLYRCFFTSLPHYFRFSPSSIPSSTAPGSSGIPISPR